MELFLLSLLALILAMIAIGLFKRKKENGQDSASLLALQQQLTDTVMRLQESLGLNLKNVTDGINARLGENKSVIEGTNRRLDEAGRYMLDLKDRLGSLSEKTAALSAIGKDISRLSDVFQSPKLRGNLGELILENLLSQIMPAGSFALQHPFSDGSRVDAALMAGGRIVPVDSKFPLENFRRFYDTAIPEEQRARLKKDFSNDVKKHIDKIAEKYVRPDEGTFDFALMYIPSETIYYEIITQDEKLGEGNAIIDHARAKRVIPVSPSSFYAYLQVILFGLKGMEIEKNAQEIQERLKKVQIDFTKFTEHFSRIGAQIGVLKNEYEESVKRFEFLDKKMSRITGSEAEV